MKIKLIIMPDNLRVKELLDIKGGVYDELQSQLEGCQKCNCWFGNENTKSKGTVIKNNK